MQSRKSFFEPTVFKKNLTRFAPAWGLYTLGLILGVFLIYTNGGEMRRYWMAVNLAELISYMSIINLIYAPLSAQLLFGDLYNSRMCNALHAMPLRRECLFVTNVVSGLVFSMLPTAVMTLVCLPLLSGSMIVNAWQIPFYLFLGANLSYLCFFGIAVFCVMCAGNRLTMTLLYCLMNFGAYILFWLVDTVYTPMLFGVNTPTALVENLTPFAQLSDSYYIKIESLHVLRQTLGEELKGVTAPFVLTEVWHNAFVYALGGAALLVPAVLLYRVRDLECAGDAVAFRILEPMCLVLSGVIGAAGFQFFLQDMLGISELNYVNLGVGLVIGWFAAKMLIARTTRVFHWKSWAGLAILAAALGLSLLATHMDILGIEDRIPDAEDVESVTFRTPYSGFSTELTEEAAIRDFLRIHQIALEDRLERSGPHIMENGKRTYYFASEYYAAIRESDATGVTIRVMQDQTFYYATDITIVYELKNGTSMSRSYIIWADGEAGRLLHPYLSTWELNGGRNTHLAHVLANLKYIAVDGAGDIDATPEMGRELVDAIKADCEAGRMAAHPYFHTGYFTVQYEQEEPYPTDSLWLRLEGGGYSWGVTVYPSCENTLAWIKQYLPDGFQILEGNILK